MSVLKLINRTDSKAEALETLESLREAVESGQLVAFACVGIEPDDATRMWSSCTQPVTRLRLIGAMASMLHSYQSDL